MSFILYMKKAKTQQYEVSLAQILENTSYVDFGEVIIPIDGLGVENEHVIFRSLHCHLQLQPLQVHVIKASTHHHQPKKHL